MAPKAKEIQPKQPICSRELFQRLMIRLGIFVAAILLLRYLLIPLIKILSPVIFAAIFARLNFPLMRFGTTKLKIPQKVLALILVLLFLVLVCVPIYFLGKEGISQVGGIMGAINNYEAPDVTKEPNEGFTWIKELVPEPWQDELQQSVNKLVKYVKERSATLWQSAITYIRSLVSKVVYVFLWTFTFFMSYYFLLAEHETIKRGLSSLMSLQMQKELRLLQDTTIAAVFKYLKGLFHLAIYCFFFMIVAFLIIGHPFVFWLALILAIFDILPIIGALTVLVPWCVYDLILGDQTYGIKLAAVIVIYFLSRRILEPKIMGDATGLHPLVTLIAIYAGSQIKGVWGAILAPIVLVLLIGLFQAGLFDDWILDFYEFKAYLRVFLKRKKPKTANGPSDPDGKN
ncbi:MAG: AI-2E family transporter [Eubacteriales bacterium]|nr:AI-2E family transporter [Eubacteriales bacterium]